MLKILGNRVLLSKVEKEKKEGEFEEVEVQDSFVYKGRVEQLGGGLQGEIQIGSIVHFAKYSPHTHDIEDMKAVRLEDIIAIE